MMKNVKILFFLCLTFIPIITCTGQDQQKKQSWYEWGKSYVAPPEIKGSGSGFAVGGAAASKYAMDAFDVYGPGLGAMVSPIAALGAASLSVPSFALANYLQGGREYLSSSYWPSYASSLAALGGLGLYAYGGSSNASKIATMLALLGTTPLMIGGHQVELKKQQRVKHAVQEVKIALEMLDTYVRKYGFSNIEHIKSKVGLVVNEMGEMKNLVTVLPRGKEVATFLETKIKEIVELNNAISKRGAGDKLSRIKKSANDAIKKVNDFYNFS